MLQFARITFAIVMMAGSMVATAAQTPITFTCETTIPVADRPAAGVNPFDEDASLYYQDGIWVTIPKDGLLELSAEQTVSFGELQGWRTETFTWLRDEGVEGFVVVSGERLDEESELRPQTPLSPQRQYTKVGWTQTGIAFPSEGCWEVTGSVASPFAGNEHVITWVMDVRFVEGVATTVPPLS